MHYNHAKFDPDHMIHNAWESWNYGHVPRSFSTHKHKHVFYAGQKTLSSSSEKCTPRLSLLSWSTLLHTLTCCQSWWTVVYSGHSQPARRWSQSPGDARTGWWTWLRSAAGHPPPSWPPALSQPGPPGGALICTQGEGQLVSFTTVQGEAHKLTEGC